MSANSHASVTENWPVVLPLPEGVLWDIADPLQKLRDKYFDGGSALSREFDLYAARRSQDPGWYNRLEGADVAATVLMNSHVESWDIDNLFRQRQAIEPALRAVPYDLDLADADLDADHDLRARLAGLFAALKRHGIGVAKASKLLCLKRSRLVPMLDYHVRRALYNCVNDKEPSLPNDPIEFGRAVVCEIIAFRRVMRWFNPVRKHTNLSVLDALAAELNRELAAEVGPDVVCVTPVRVLDNLLWMDWHGAVHHFGYQYDQQAQQIVKV